MKNVPTMPKIKQSAQAASGRSKVISTGKLAGVRGGSTKMFGKQTVKAAKAK